MTGEEDALLGGSEREHAVGLDAFVAAGDGGAQLLRAGYLRVAQAQPQEPLARIGLEREQVLHGAGLAVAAGEHQAGVELPTLVEALELERLHSHAGDAMSRAWAPVAGARS